MRGLDGLGGVVITPEMPPLGPEQSRKTREKSLIPGDVPPYVPPSLPIMAELIEVLEQLSPDDLLAVIEFARARIVTQNTQNPVGPSAGG